MEQETFHNTMAMLETSMPILGIFHGKLLVITRLGSHHWGSIHVSKKMLTSDTSVAHNMAIRSDRTEIQQPWVFRVLILKTIVIIIITAFNE